MLVKVKGEDIQMEAGDSTNGTVGEVFNDSDGYLGPCRIYLNKHTERLCSLSIALPNDVRPEDIEHIELTVRQR